MLLLCHRLQKLVGCNPKGQNRFSSILGLISFPAFFVKHKKVSGTACFLHVTILLSCTELKIKKAVTGKLMKTN